MIIYDVILDLLVFYRIRVPLMPESSRMTKGYCIPHLVAFYFNPFVHNTLLLFSGGRESVLGTNRLRIVAKFSLRADRKWLIRLNSLNIEVKFGGSPLLKVKAAPISPKFSSIAIILLRIHFRENSSFLLKIMLALKWSIFTFVANIKCLALSLEIVGCG